MSWNVQCRHRGVPGGKISTLYSTFLPQYLFRHAEKAYARGDQNAEGEIHAQESKEAARRKAKDVVERLRAMRLNEAAKKVEEGIEETLTYMDFPSQHWLKIRTNNVVERMNREIRRRTRVVGAFPDGHSALMLVCARLRYVSGKEWGSKRYLCMKYLTTIEVA